MSVEKFLSFLAVFGCIFDLWLGMGSKFGACKNNNCRDASPIQIKSCRVKTPMWELLVIDF